MDGSTIYSFFSCCLRNRSQREAPNLSLMNPASEVYQHNIQILGLKIMLSEDPNFLLPLQIDCFLNDARKLPVDTLIGLSSYLESLSYKSKTWFCQALNFMISTKTFMLLSDESLEFLQELSDRSTLHYHQLTDTISKNARKIDLKSHHIDVVINIFRLQQHLDPEIYAFVCQHLDINLVKDAILLSRKMLLPHIISQSREKTLSHHTINHAEEIKTRVIHILKELEIFGDADDILRALVKFAIEGHDLKQRARGNFATDEMATVHELEHVLFGHLGLNTEETTHIKIKSFIHLMFSYIIVLGTTMVFSHESTVDLGLSF